jgi:hypothetical protein
MPYYLASHRARCSPGSKRTSKKDKKPIVCRGSPKKRKSSKRGCKHGRNPKTSKCYSKREFASRMKAANKRFSRNKSAAAFVKRLKTYRPARTSVHELD